MKIVYTGLETEFLVHGGEYQVDEILKRGYVVEVENFGLQYVKFSEAILCE